VARLFAVVVAVVAVTVVVMMSTTASAQTSSEREQAKAHFRAGRAHVEAKRYELAIQEFEKGYALQPLPGFLFNAGSVARLANQPERAVRYLDRYLAATIDEPDSAERRDARAWVAEMRRALPPEPPPEVTPPPPPAVVAPAVTVDDEADLRRRKRRNLAIGLGVAGGLLVLGGVAAAIAVPLSSGPAGPPPGTADWGTLAINPR
jgi:tetratricopeptide (TPR) repeat protein